MPSLFDTPELLRLLLGSPGVCVRLLGVSRAPRLAALAELRERLQYTTPDALAGWLLEDMAGAPATTRSLDFCREAGRASTHRDDAMQSAQAAYAAARLPVYGLSKRKRYDSHTEWATLRPRLLEAASKLLRLPQLLQAAAVASVAPLEEAPDVPVALPPALVLRLLDAIDGTTCRVGATLASSIEVAPSLRAKIGEHPFGLGLQVQARDAALELYEPRTTERHAHALRAGFKQHGVRWGAGETVSRLRSLLEAALAACETPPPSLRAHASEADVDAASVSRLSDRALAERLRAAHQPTDGSRAEQADLYVRVAAPATATTARRRAVLEAALAAVSDDAQQRFTKFLAVEADKAAALAAAAKAVKSAPPSEAAAAAAALARAQATAAAEAAAVEAAVAEELTEEDPLLATLLPPGGIGLALERTALEETAREAREAMAAAEEVERQRRFERMPAHPDRQRQSQPGGSGASSGRWSHADHSGRGSGAEASGRSSGGEAEGAGMDQHRRRAEKAERRVRSLEAQGVRAYDATVRMARAFLHAPRTASEHRSLYDLAVDLRCMLRDVEEGAASSALAPPSVAQPPPVARPPHHHPPQHNSGTAAPAPAGHVCTGACAKLVSRTPLERALVGQLRHLLLHCDGTGVSAFPAPLCREPLSGCHAPNGNGARGESSGGGGGDAVADAPGDSLLVWACTVVAPVDTPWEGRKVRCSLRFCPAVCGGQYPSVPPELRVLAPRPYHPNIDVTSGKVCMDILDGGWSAGLGILGLLLSFRSLLASPSRGDATSMPANVRAARLLLAAPDAYRQENRAIAEAMDPADA